MSIFRYVWNFSSSPALNEGDFVAVGLQVDDKKKGPLYVFMAEVLAILPNDVTLKYAIRRRENVYQWQEHKDAEISTEPIQSLICPLQIQDIPGNRSNDFTFSDLHKVQLALGNDNFKFK